MSSEENLFGAVDRIVNAINSQGGGGSGRVVYPITARGSNPSGLALGTLVAMPGEPAGTPVGLLLVLTVAAVSYNLGIIASTGAMTFNV